MQWYRAEEGLSTVTADTVRPPRAPASPPRHTGAIAIQAVPFYVEWGARDGPQGPDASSDCGVSADIRLGTPPDLGEWPRGHAPPDRLTFAVSTPPDIADHRARDCGVAAGRPAVARRVHP